MLSHCTIIIQHTRTNGLSHYDYAWLCEDYCEISKMHDFHGFILVLFSTIVFNGGRLEYIDYDTKDVTFDKMVPAAYQVSPKLGLVVMAVVVVAAVAAAAAGVAEVCVCMCAHMSACMRGCVCLHVFVWSYLCRVCGHVVPWQCGSLSEFVPYLSHDWKPDCKDNSVHSTCNVIFDLALY